MRHSPEEQTAVARHHCPPPFPAEKAEAGVTGLACSCAATNL